VQNCVSTCSAALQRNAVELAAQVAALQGELAATLQQFDGITDVTRVGASTLGSGCAGA
jgi:hypothetical protein